MADQRYGNASGPKRAVAKIEKAKPIDCEGNADSRVTIEDAHKAKANP